MIAAWATIIRRCARKVRFCDHQRYNPVAICLLALLSGNVCQVGMTTGTLSARPLLDWRRIVQLCLILPRCCYLLGGHHAVCNFAHLQMDIKTKQELGAAERFCTIAQSMVLPCVSGLTCGFSWGCQSGCEQDFRCWCGHWILCCARAECACSQPCPQDWREVQMNPGICTVGRTFCFACMHLPMCPEAPTTYPGASVK